MVWLWFSRQSGSEKSHTSFGPMERREFGELGEPRTILGTYYAR